MPHPSNFCCVNAFMQAFAGGGPDKTCIHADKNS